MTTNNSNTNTNGYSSSSSVSEFKWDFPQSIINNNGVIFNSIITPTKITLKDKTVMKPTPSYGKCFILVDKSKIPTGANSDTFMANQKVAITGGQTVSYDTMSPTFVNSFSDIASIHFPNAFGHISGEVFNPSSTTTPFVLINGKPIISLTEYVQLSGFNPTATDGWYADYSSPMTESQFVNATGNTLAGNAYQQSISNHELWVNAVAPTLSQGTLSSVVVPVESLITVDLYSNKTNTDDEGLQNTGITYSSWSCKYMGYQSTYNSYLANSFNPQSNSISIPSSVQNQQQNWDISCGIYYVAQPNGNGTWNTSVLPTSGVFQDGSITVNGNFSINGVNFTSNYVQTWSTSTVKWNNDSSGNWMYTVTDTGKIYPNSDYTLDQIFTGSVLGVPSYNYVSFNLTNTGFNASFITPNADSEGNIPMDYLWTSNSDGISGGDGSWLLNPPSMDTFLLSGYYYNVLWSGSVGWGQNWNVTIQGPYPALNAVTFDQLNNNTNINTYGSIVQITIPVVNYIQYNVNERSLTDSGINDLDKIANKYYKIGDTIVSAYYNHCLQVTHYLQTLSTVSNTNENLVKYLNVAVAYNLLAPLLTEWIRGYPLTSLPQATQAIYSSLGDNSSISDINAMISNFFLTEIPGGVTGVTLCSTSESSADNEAAQVLTPSWQIQGVALMPDAVRFILSNTLGMGVLLQHLASQTALLRHLQSSLTSLNSGGSLPTNEMSLNAQQTQVASLITNVMQSQYNNSQDSSSINPSLFFPSVDEVTALVMTKVEGIRDLVIDRIYGMNQYQFNQELSDILQNFSQEVHALLIDFCNIVTTSTDFVTPRYPAISNIAKAVDNTVVSSLAHPIAFSLALVTRLVADAIGDISNLTAPGSEILTLFEDANILRPVPVALAPTEINSLFSYASSATEYGFSNIDWWGIDYEGNLLSVTTAPTPSDVSTDAPGALTLTGGAGTSTWTKTIQLNDGVYKQTLLTNGGLVDVWMSSMWEVCNDGKYHRTGNQSIYFVPHPVTDVDGKISIPKSFHKFITVGLLSASLLYGIGCIDAASQALTTMSQWDGFENFKSHISIEALTTAEIADAGAATIAASLGVADLFGNASGAKEEFTIAAEDTVNAVKVGMVYSRAAAFNVLNAVQDNLDEVKTMFKNIYSSNNKPDDGYLFNFSTTSTMMNPYAPPLPLYYKESGAYLFGDVIFATAKVGASLWVQHKVFKHFSDLSTAKKENDLKKDAVLGTIGTFALNKYHRIVNNSKRIKELDSQSKKINAAFQNEPMYEKLSQKDLTGMSKQELSDLQTSENDLSSLLNDMVDNVGSRGLN